MRASSSGRVATANLVLLAICASASTAATIHVPSDRPTIQAGVDSAAVGDTVLVASGTYQGTGNWYIGIRGKDLVVRSESGAEGTTIQGTGGQYTQSGFFLLDLSSSAVIEGFTITGAGVNPLTGVGGAIECRDSSPTIRGCTLVGNSAVSDFLGRGGGMSCNGYTSAPILEDCVFESNVADYGGGLYCAGSSPTIVRCKFISNHSFQGGSGVYCELDAAPHVLDSEFIGNGSTSGGKGGAIGADTGSAPTFQNCRFRLNRSSNGGAIYCLDSSISVVASTFHQNSGYFGAVIYAEASSVTLERVIIAFNSLSNAVECFADPSFSLSCCNLFGNDGPDYSACIDDHAWVNGNFELNPLFCDPLSGDLHLDIMSPCMPGRHPYSEDCGPIGAFPEGCGRTSVENPTFELSSWGRVKTVLK